MLQMREKLRSGVWMGNELSGRSVRVEDGGASRLSKHKTGGFQWCWQAGAGRGEYKIGRLLDGWGWH